MLEEPPVLTIRKKFPRPTKAQVAAFKGVETGFVCDAMDGRGALDCSIQPLGDGEGLGCAAVGPAIVAENGPEDMLAIKAALHVMEAGDILIAAVNAARNCATVGDQFCGMLRNKGAAGYVTDGQVRDIDGITAAGLPVWCAGLSPNSPYSTGPGRVGRAAEIGGRRVESGDLVVADRNGVVVVPHAEIDAVAGKVAHIATIEEEFAAKVADGFCEMTAIAEMIKDGRAVEE